MPKLPRLQKPEILQLDGTYISLGECTCPQLWEATDSNYAVDCPIDHQRVKWLHEHWQFTDSGELIVIDREEESYDDLDKCFQRYAQAGRGKH